MRLRDKLLCDALKDIKCLRLRLDSVERDLCEIQDAQDEVRSATIQINAVADDLNSVVSSNPVPK